MRVFAFCLVALSFGWAEETVRVEGGLLSGRAGKSPEIRVYKGIPYAAPPTGALRWQPPQAAAKWGGVRDAAKFSPTCMQVPFPEGSP